MVRGTCLPVVAGFISMRTDGLDQMGRIGSGGVRFGRVQFRFVSLDLVGCVLPTTYFRWKLGPAANSTEILSNGRCILNLGLVSREKSPSIHEFYGPKKRVRKDLASVAYLSGSVSK